MNNSALSIRFKVGDKVLYPRRINEQAVYSPAIVYEVSEYTSPDKPEVYRLYGLAVYGVAHWISVSAEQAKLLPDIGYAVSCPQCGDTVTVNTSAMIGECQDCNARFSVRVE